MHKSFLDEKLLKINGQISFLEKENNEFRLQYNKQSVEEILIQRVVKMTIQIFHDKGIFDAFPNADKVLKDFFTTRRRPGL